MGAECFTARCEACGSADVVTDYGAGDIVCRACGLILGERIVDDSPEWRTFANDDRGGDAAAKSRVGDAMDRHFEAAGGSGDSLTTFLVNTEPTKKTNGAGAAAGEKPHRRPSLKTESARDRRVSEMLAKIQHVCEALALPKSLVDVAMDVYTQAEKKGVSMRGQEKDSMGAAVVFIACRHAGSARSLKEMEAASGVAKSRIGKSFLLLSKKLQLELLQASTEDYVRRFCSRLGLPHKTQAVAYDVAKRAESLGLSTGKSPIAVAASVIYLVAAYTDAKRSLQEISDVTMIGEKKVKVVCKELNKSRVVLFEGVVLT